MTHPHAHVHDTDLARLLELDAQVLPFTGEILDWVDGLLPHRPEHVVDLGAGTGHGSLALASRFPAAHLTAVDRSPVMVSRLRERLGGAELGGRARVVHADVAAGWGDVDGPADLVWASAVLHEVEDPRGLFAAVLPGLRSGGWFAVIEMDSPPRFLPRDLGLGEPGLEDRIHEVLAVSSGRAMHPRWGGPLQDSGFTDVVEQRFTLQVQPPTLPQSRSSPPT